MLLEFRKSLYDWRRKVLVLGLCAVVAGCASWNPRGPGFKDEPKIGRPANPLFPANKATGLWGYSTKARQIERNLGVE